MLAMLAIYEKIVARDVEKLRILGLKCTGHWPLATGQLRLN